MGMTSFPDKKRARNRSNSTKCFDKRKSEAMTTYAHT